jgi:tetratricopeptide (TPR) repeat protein
LAGPPSAWYRCRKFGQRNKAALATVSLVAVAVLLAALSIGWAVRDRAARDVELELAEKAREAKLAYAEAARRTHVEGQVRDALNRARTLLADNKIIPARQAVAEARARLGSDKAVLTRLAADVEDLSSHLERFDQFFAWIDKAHQAEYAQSMSLTYQEHGSSLVRWGRGEMVHQPEKAAPFLFKALSVYGILEDDGWTSALEKSPLAPEQVKRVRLTAYEELLWLADITVGSRKRKEKNHVNYHTRERISPQAAGRLGLTYLQKAESAHAASWALLVIRSTCRHATGEDALRLADQARARETEPTLAVDYMIRGAASAWVLNDNAQAIKEFEAGLGLDPTHYWLMLALGDTHLDLGKPENLAAASGIYTGCIMNRPNHAYGYLRRGTTQFRLGRRDQALADFDKAIKLDPNEADAWHNRGMVYAEQGQEDKALADFQEALRLDPNYSIGHCNLGIMLLNKGRVDDALVALDRAVKLDPKDGLSVMNLGLGYMVKGRWKEAVARLEEADRLIPNHPYVQNNLGKLALEHRQDADGAIAFLKKAVQSKPDFPEAHYNLGLAFMTKGVFAEAWKGYHDAIRLKPTWPLPHNNLGILLRDAGQLDAAKAALEEAIKHDANYAEAYSNLGSVLVRQMKADDAIAACNKALKIKKFPEAYQNLGNALGAKGQRMEAKAAWQAAIRLNEDYAPAYVNLAIALEREGKREQAIKLMKEAIRRQESSAEAHYNLALLFKANGQWDEAIPEYRLALRYRPHMVAWHIGLINTLSARNRKDEAIATCREALKHHPKAAELHAELARALYDQKDPDGAFREFRLALEIKEDSPRVHYNFGSALMTHKDLPAAVQHFQRAIELDPNYAEAHCNLGHALWRQGKFADALPPLKRGHALGSQRPGWNYPSQTWISQVESFAVLDAKLPKVLGGEVKAKDAAELIALARLCQEYKKQYAAAAGLYTDAFVEDPKQILQHRYNAACAAALAGCSQGRDDGKLHDRERGRLRRLALNWLRADLAVVAKRVQEGKADAILQAESYLAHWQSDPDFTGVRADKAVAALPESDQAAWGKLWADVDQLLKQVRSKITQTTFQGALTAKELTQVHEMKLQAGKTYVIDMKSTELDSYLKLFGPTGKLVAENDDIAPNNLDSRIIFTPNEDGVYRITATSFQERGRGAYTLTVRAVAGK